MYNLEKLQCELYDKYCLKKTCRNVENDCFLFFDYFLTIYIYVYYNNYVIITIFELEEQDEMTDGDD